MNKIKTQAMVDTLLKNADGLQYGSVSVTAKLHNGRVVQVTYSTQEHSRDIESLKDKHE
jgi:hypothetical protein